MLPIMSSALRCATTQRMLLAALLLLGCRHASAVTWRLSKAVESPLQVWTGYPPNDDPDCTRPGICTGYNMTLPNGTLWYWCGWSTKERTQYWITAYDKNITAVLMRESDLKACALTNLTNIKNCFQLPDSICDTQTSCEKKVYGMAFVDPMCFLLANNERSGSTQVQLKMWQYYDSRRYYGTVFSILFAIFIFCATLLNVGHTCWYNIRKPNHRFSELDKINNMRSGLAGAAPPVAELAAEEPMPKSNIDGTGHPAMKRTASGGLVYKLKNMLAGNKGTHNA